MATTVANLIARARLHHGNFVEDRHPNVVLLSLLSTRHRELLRDLAGPLKDRLSESRNIADTIDGALVGISASGGGGAGGPATPIAYSVTTSGDGYDVIVDTGGFAYTGPTVIATDPYSAGFVLPADSIQIIDLYGVATDSGKYLEIEVVPQQDIHKRSGSSAMLFAIMNGWRLIPIQNPPSNTGTSLWDRISSVTVTWIDNPVVFSVTGDWGAQTFSLPDPYVDALEWELAAFMAAREVVTGDTDIAAGYADRLQRDADRRMAAVFAGSRSDHRPVKFRQARRSR
jgi:hypothetical protein